MSIKPIRDRILVKPAEVETQTQSGIYIPNGDTDKPLQGTVVAVGTGKVTEDGIECPIEVQDGDTVIYTKYAGHKVKIKDTDYVVLKEEDILVIIE